MVTDKKTSTVGSIVEMFDGMTPAESLRKREKTGLVIPEVFAGTQASGRSSPSARCRPARPDMTSTGPASTVASAWWTRSTTARSESCWLGSAGAGHHNAQGMGRAGLEQGHHHPVH